MNSTVQKKSFSGQKKAPLFKPMLCVFPDGYIYEIFPFNTGVANDASIIKRILIAQSRFSRYFQEGDVFILDRGFRDAFRDLQAKGFIVYTPAFVAGREQLSWDEANRNRVVTKNRWVV